MSNFDSHYLQKQNVSVDGDLLHSEDLVSDYEKDFTTSQSAMLLDAHKKAASSLVSSSLLSIDDIDGEEDASLEDSALIKLPFNARESLSDTYESDVASMNISPLRMDTIFNPGASSGELNDIALPTYLSLQRSMHSANPALGDASGGRSISSPLYAARQYLYQRFMNTAKSNDSDIDVPSTSSINTGSVNHASEGSFASSVFGQSFSRRLFSKRRHASVQEMQGVLKQGIPFAAYNNLTSDEIPQDPEAAREFENYVKRQRNMVAATAAAPYRLARARQAYQLKHFPRKSEKISYKIQKNEQRLELLRLRRERKLREVKAQQRLLASKKAQMSQTLFTKRKKRLARHEKRLGQARFREKFITKRIGSLKNRLKRVLRFLSLTRFALLGRVFLFVPLIVGAFVGFLLLLTLIAGSMGAMHRANYEGMNEYESAVARFLIEKEIDPLHVAAIMGNIAAESEFDPAKIEAPHAAAGDGFGLCQWSFDRRRQLTEYAFSQGLSPSSIDVQLDFLYAELTGQGAAGLFSNIQMNFDEFLAIDDLERAVYYFGRRFERPNEAYAHWERRIEAAKRYYAILTMGAGGVLGGTDVVSAAYSVAANATPYVYGGNDIVHGCDCSYFTQWCYAQAGISIPRNSEAQKAAGIAIPLSEAQPGDLVWLPGHIGIYISPTTVIEQTPPYCRVNSLRYNRWVCAVRILH